MGTDPSFLLSLCWNMAYLICRLTQRWIYSGSGVRFFHCKQKSREECCWCPKCRPRFVETSARANKGMSIRRKGVFMRRIRFVYCVFFLTSRKYTLYEYESVGNVWSLCMCHFSLLHFTVLDQMWYCATNVLASTSCSFNEPSSKI